MANPKYIEFKKWLYDTNRLDRCPDAVGYVYVMNKNLEKRMRYSEVHSRFSDVFDMVQYEDYKALYSFRRNYFWNTSTAEKETVLQLLFEYYGKSFDSFRQYEIESILRSYKPSTLFVCRGSIACTRYHHPIEDVAATIAVNNGNSITIHASRCKKCNIVFIQKAYYLQLRRQYKFMIAHFCELAEDGFTIVPQGSFAAESPLMLCGYTVNQGDNLSDEERQSILAGIVCNGILSKTQIIEYLEKFLVFNAGREALSIAKEKWENDLDFIRNFDLKSHPEVPIIDIRPYSKRA